MSPYKPETDSVARLAKTSPVVARPGARLVLWRWFGGCGCSKRCKKLRNENAPFMAVVWQRGVGVVAVFNRSENMEVVVLLA